MRFLSGSDVKKLAQFVIISYLSIVKRARAPLTESTPRPSESRSAQKMSEKRAREV